MTFLITKTHGPLGAEIGGVDLSQPLDHVTQKQIYEAWLAHSVIVFRGQRLTDEALAAFSARFGRLERAPIVEKHSQGRSNLPTIPEVAVISNVLENGVPIGALGDGELVWHSDMTYIETPPPASILYGVEVPRVGADTWFNSMYRAYESMPPALRKRIETLFCNHDAAHTSAGTLRRGFEDVKDVTQVPGAKHSMVLTHPQTGRKALYLGRRDWAWIVGLSIAESEALLDEVWQYAKQPDIAFAHKWQVGDVVMWDNRCVMHRRDAFDPTARRVLHRTQLIDFTVH
ncbi:MAG: TauD/TfdA family dioxygenase [Burkholderiales bacterium]